MYQNLRKKLEEAAPLYYEEEILWLLDYIALYAKKPSADDFLLLNSILVHT